MLQTVSTGIHPVGAALLLLSQTTPAIPVMKSPVVETSAVLVTLVIVGQFALTLYKMYSNNKEPSNELASGIQPLCMRHAEKLGRLDERLASLERKTCGVDTGKKKGS